MHRPLVLCFAIAAGCADASGSSSGAEQRPDPGNAELAELFETPMNAVATPGSILGVWAPDGTGSVNRRFKVTKTSFVIATKCNGEIKGATVAAQVTTTTIRILESKLVDGTKMGNVTTFNSACGFAVSTGEYSPCSEGQLLDCFELDGTKLRSEGDVPPQGRWFKVSD